MTVEVIPAGASAVITEKDNNWARDAERVKDVLAAMQVANGSYYGDTVKTIKDAEADLERSVANHFENTIQDVKDAETRLGTSIANHFENTIQDVKDAETRMTKNSSDQFERTLTGIYDGRRQTLESATHTNEIVENVRFEVAKEAGTTREHMVANFRDAEKTAYQNQIETLKGFKESELRAERLAAHQELLSERLAAKQELLSEKLYAATSKEMAECCCELKREVGSVKDALKQQEIDRLREELTTTKLLGRRFRTFSPVPAGTLQAEED